MGDTPYTSHVIINHNVRGDQQQTRHRDGSTRNDTAAAASGGLAASSTLEARLGPPASPAFACVTTRRIEWNHHLSITRDARFALYHQAALRELCPLRPVSQRPHHWCRPKR
jgi:hypothetical protein